MVHEGNFNVETEAISRECPIPDVKEYSLSLLSNFEIGIKFMNEVLRS
jgi:hypothetical protein